MAKVLNDAQAAAVYRAMAELNNVGGLLSTTIREDGGYVTVYQTPNEDGRPGRVRVERIKHSAWSGREQYASQAEFAEAYGVE